MLLSSVLYSSAQSIPTLDQFIATSSPISAITQRHANTPLVLTGYIQGCAQFTSTSTLISTGVNCGSGSGGSTATTTINGASGPTFTFATSSAGTNFSISTSTNTVTFNIPFAASTATGLLTAADWSTFNGKFTLPALTNGSVLFATSTNTIGQDNANFFFDSTNHRLGIGTTTPLATLDIFSTTTQNTGLNIQGNINNFFQGNIQNTSSTTNASSDWITTANNGNDNQHYSDLGINSSAGGLSPFTTANQGYVYSASDSFNVGALGASSSLIFFSGGSTSTPVEVGRFTSAGRFGIGTTTPAAKFDLYSTDGTSDIFAISSSTNSRLVTIDSIGRMGVGSSTPRAQLSVQGLTSTANGVAGIDGINVLAGTGASGGVGGNVIFTAGGGGSGAAGGQVFINGGAGNSTLGGNVTIAGGLGNGSGNGGILLLKGGNSSSASGGATNIRSGTGISGSLQGTILIQPADPSGSASSNAALTIQGAGIANSGSADGGLVDIVGGIAESTNQRKGGNAQIHGGLGGSSSVVGGAGGDALLFGGTGTAGSSAGPGGNAYIYGGAPSSGTTLFGNTILGLTSGGVAQGNIGIGSSTPNAAYVAIKNKPGTLDAFDISSSTVSATTTLFRVKANGNIGLATTSPDSVLDVNGNFRLEGVSAVVTSSISGAIIGIGCDTATTSVDATVSSSTVFITTPQTFPGAGLFWQTYLSATGVITTEVCSDVTVTPTASTYNVRIIK